jgi:Ca2+-binding RTX toxin-like protein
MSTIDFISATNGMVTFQNAGSIVDEFGIGQVISLGADLGILAQQQRFINSTNYLQELLLAEQTKFVNVAIAYRTQATSVNDQGQINSLTEAAFRCDNIASALLALANSPKAIAQFWLKPEYRTTTEWQALHATADAFNEFTVGGYLSAASTVLGVATMFVPEVGIPLKIALALAPDLARLGVYQIDAVFKAALLDQIQAASGIKILAEDGNLTSVRTGTNLYVGVIDSGASSYSLSDENSSVLAGVSKVTFVGNDSANAVDIKLNSISSLEVFAGGGDETIVVTSNGGILPVTSHITATTGIKTVTVEGQNIVYDGSSDTDLLTVKLSGPSTVINTNAGADVVTLVAVGTSFGNSFTVDTGSGDDVIRIGDVGDGIIIGGLDSDTVDYSGIAITTGQQGTTGLKIDFSNQGPGTQVEYGNAHHTLIGIENIILTKFADEVKGDSQDNKFEGLGGNDTLVGGGGSDTLDGGKDFDTVDYSKESGGGIKITLGGGTTTVIDGTGGHDTLISIEKIIGTAKDDTLLLTSTTDTTRIDLGEGKDTVDLSNAGSGVTVSLYSNKVGSLEVLNAENIIGTAGADDITGNEAMNKLVGGGGEDFIKGGEGNDNLYNGDANGSDDGVVDKLYGGSGIDVYYVGNGDIINDYDHLGSVYFKGKLLGSGSLYDGGWGYLPDGDKNWYSDNNTINYHLQEGNLANLVVDFLEPNSAHINYSITIENFHSGDLGITLDPSNFHPKTHRSPLVLDLNGDGVSLVDLKASNVYFDMDNDGLKERTGWVAATDGILALDRNQNGLIDDASELFGSSGTLSDVGFDGIFDTRGDSGFHKLLITQTVFDGVLDSKDAVFNELRVWRDLNQDGVSDKGELFSLNDLGIVSIRVDSTAVPYTFGVGNKITEIATFTFQDGHTAQIADVWFQIDQQDVRFDKPDISAAIQALPQLDHEGAVKDLHSAAATDPVLAKQLTDLSHITLADIPTFFSLVQDIEDRWHNVNLVNHDSRGVFADSHHIAVYESYYDTPVLQHALLNPRPLAGAMLEERYQQILRDDGAKLFLQTDIGKTLFPEVSLVNGFTGLAKGTTYHGFQL